MDEHKQIIGELKHLIGYTHQAAHEFFDDVSNEFIERLDEIYACLEQDKNSLDEYRGMIRDLDHFQTGLAKKVEDLRFLTDRMNQLLTK